MIADHEHAGVADPDLLAIRPEHPVLRAVARTRRPDLVAETLDPLSVVRVHRADPEARIVQEPLGREPEELLDVGTDVDRGGALVVVVDVDDAGKLLDELAYARFRGERIEAFGERGSLAARHRGSVPRAAIRTPDLTYPAYGRMAERTKATVLKTVSGATRSWVRIPLLPPISSRTVRARRVRPWLPRFDTSFRPDQRCRRCIVEVGSQ